MLLEPLGCHKRKRSAASPFLSAVRKVLHGDQGVQRSILARAHSVRSHGRRPSCPSKRRPRTLQPREVELKLVHEPCQLLLLHVLPSIILALLHGIHRSVYPGVKVEKSGVLQILKLRVGFLYEDLGGPDAPPGDGVSATSSAQTSPAGPFAQSYRHNPAARDNSCCGRRRCSCKIRSPPQALGSSSSANAPERRESLFWNCACESLEASVYTCQCAYISIS